MKLLIILFTLLFTTSLIAQNLVPNGDFETLISLPVKPNPNNSYRYEPLSGYKPFMYNIKNWFAATESTPDLRITDMEKYKVCEKRHDDCERAHSGIVCAGIIVFQKNKKYDTFREYVEVKLTKKLDIGKTVNIEYWVRKEREAKLITNNIGCYLSERKIYAEIKDQIKIQTQFNYDQLINQTDSKWLKISGQIKVDKPYEYLTIGNFYSNENTTVKTYGDYTGNAYTPPYAYYLIDDVKLWYEGSKPTLTKAKKKLNTRIFTEPNIIEQVQLEFEYNSVDIKMDATNHLDSLIQKLQNSTSDYQIEIIGHTDDKGSIRYNLDLSSQRANSVREYFISKGIKPNLLSSKGVGEGQALVANDSENNRAKNRRVEIRMTKIE